MTGRPSSYKPEYAKKAVELAVSGLTDAEMAEEFGVSRVTFWQWKCKHKEFAIALKAAKGEPDDRVEASLYKRAIGFEHEAVKVFMPAGADKPVYAPYREYVLPDVTAQIFWLKNRRKETWRDKSELDVKVTEELASRLSHARQRAKS